MTTQGWIAVLVLVGTIALFVSDRVRLDLVAMLALLALTLTGVVTPQEALAGFSNPVVIMIAALFVVGAGLSKTGVAEWLGRRMASLAGSDERRLLVVIMATAALLSGFMSSTGTVAVLLPVVVSIAQRLGSSPGRFLIPLSFASLLGGMLTLVGTPPNLIVSEELRAAGLSPFRFFSFSPAGLVMLVLGVMFMLLVGRRLLPGSPAKSTSADEPPPSITLSDLAVDYGLGKLLSTLVVGEGSPLIGKTLGKSELRSGYGLNVVGLVQGGAKHGISRQLVPTVQLQEGDILRVQATPSRLERAARELRLIASSDTGVLDLPDEESLAEVVLPRHSRLVGKTLQEANFRTRYRATVLALQRGDDRPDPTDFDTLATERLRPGDMLLLKGTIKHLQNLREHRKDLVIVTEPSLGSRSRFDAQKAWLAVGATLGMLVLMSFGVVSNAIAVLIAAVAMVLFRCIAAADAYREINWESVVLIAGVLPIATALESTGVMRLAVGTMVAHLGDAGPYVVMAALFLVTAAFSQVISNTATTVLVAPIAFGVAVQLNLAPEPLLMTVAFAASAAFSTPIASPTNTIVLGPGGYRFGDFVKVGVPLQLLLFVATLVIVPLLFPL